MLEVCQYPSGNSPGPGVLPLMMKHSAPNVEVFEFNLGKAPELDDETKELNTHIKEIKEWFPRLGDHSRKRFMLGLMQRFHSVDLLQQVVKLLNPVQCKDFTYSRSRTNPSLQTDSTTLSADRAMRTKEVEDRMSSTWHWFQDCNYWTKANFALTLLQMCDTHLLHSIGIQARTLLIAQEKAAASAQEEDYTERASIASSTYSYHTNEHPDVKFLASVSPTYGTRAVNPFTDEELPFSDLDDEIENADSGDEATDDTSLSSMDPAYMVIPTSSKAYAGVGKYRDFIRLMPVHISKLILSMLDQGSLANALCVNKVWRSHVEQVMKESDINRQLKDDVMLMQGAAAQGANPEYAKDIDVLVPNLHPNSSRVIRTDNAVQRTTFKSEVSFETAYQGISTRKVIMEERNVYCGAYNVMVLCNQYDAHRVVHTDGGSRIAIGSKDRKVRFIDTASGKEMTPVIHGHAGSVRCVHLCESRGFVLSGSYDTSIRLWNIVTGQCMKIFRGHRDTVLTILVVGEMLISGSKDKSCKVWNLQTGKCHRTFRHKYPVQAVAMAGEMVVSGCEGGKIKVWNLKSGELIKTLTGHQGAVTVIKFDRWHIVTGGRDNYALVWSTQGDHNRLIMALRHPKEVLCLEFMYLRVITGCADGRIRIWNMINGTCCRIMRGNSRSDPIQNILAIDDRITINTNVNLLVLNFEKVVWNYDLSEDRVPPLVQYGSYSEAPVRQQPYPYIRAQRMKKAGASNVKILKHNLAQSTDLPGKPPMSQISFKAQQIPHSAKSLSAKSLRSAHDIQRLGSGSGSRTLSPRTEYHLAIGQYGLGEGQISRVSSGLPTKPSSSQHKPPLPKSAKSRPHTSKSAVSAAQSVTIIDEVTEKEADVWREPIEIKRRVSWAFEKPLLPKSNGITLSETKALLRSQMRMKSESIVPPDFIYLTVNAIQASISPSETSVNMERNILDAKTVQINTRINRPSSSPGKIDPRTKIPVEELDLEQFISKDGEEESLSDLSDLKSIKSAKTKDSLQVESTHEREVYATKCQVKQFKTAPKLSLQPKRIRTTLPRGRTIRPISASVVRREPREEPQPKAGRPGTAPILRVRPDTASTMPSNIAGSLPGAQPHKRKGTGVSTVGYEANLVPMLMYPPDMKEKLQTLLKEKKQQKLEEMIDSASEIGVGKVSPYNDPLRSHAKFELRTHAQEKEYIAGIEKMYHERRRKEEAALERKKKLLWTAKAKGKDIHLSESPEIA